MSRRRLLLIIGLAVLSISVAIGVFVCTFDLNRYRSEIARRLATALHRPVHLGEARLSLRPGLALSFADLRIGPDDSGTGELSADRLFLLIDPWPLLKGELTFHEVAMVAPRLTLAFGRAATSQPGRPRTGERLERALIHTLQIENGALRLIDRRDPERPQTYDFRNIRGQATDLSLDRPWKLDLLAALVQGKNAAPLVLAGEIAPPADLARWREARLGLHLEAQHLDPAPLLPVRHALEETVKTEGNLSLKLDLTGAPASGLRIEGALTGNDFSLHLPLLYRSPLPLRRAAIESTWTAGGEIHEFTDLALTLDGAAVNGALALRRQKDKFWLEGELSTPVLALNEIRRFLPDRYAPVMRLKKDMSGGTLRIEAVRFAGHPDRFRRIDENFPLREGKFSIQDAAFRLDQAETVTGVNVAASWKDRRLVLEEGSGVVLESPFDFSGSLSLSDQGAPQVTASIRGTASSGKLLSLVPADKQTGISVSGSVPVALELGGSLDRLMVDLQADLKNLSGRLDEKFTKPAGLQGSLFLTGEIGSGRLDLNHSRLSIPPLELRARGSLAWMEEKGFSLVLDLAPLDLQKARARTPLLEKFAPEGEIAVHYEVEGSAGKINRRGGTVSLRNFGIHLPGPVGDISQANGEIRLRKSRAETARLTARLGTSLIEVAGTLEDYSNPRLDLRVRGQAIRANDLIFPSDRAVLRDVIGHLVITREGIDFAPVDVRLDGGTRATVRGTLRNFKAPETILEIEAEYGNIDEVIGLWRRPGEAGPKESRKASGKSTLYIDARAREGVLGPLHFQDARGEITLNEGILNIFPLRFSAGSGSCVGQVVVDGRGGPPSLLKISGHLEDIDAAALHHELLKRRGLITGTLSGDFYLEGRAGKEFLSTSLGGFDLKVRDGVLLKFKFLSRVFSLLNVSQILTLQLPDMDQKGMPFERLAGTFGLRGGILSTEDLFVKSNAMNLSLVGDADLIRGRIDMILGVKPLRTVDKIITHIPIAGWLLTGEEKALITAHFHIRGRSDDPDVVPIPITSVSEKVRGIFRRVLELPGKVITDVESVLGGGSK